METVAQYHENGYTLTIVCERCKRVEQDDLADLAMKIPNTKLAQVQFHCRDCARPSKVTVHPPDKVNRS